eukprot:m.82762 g.82762  ORF g.82762 m.82762 type:complete len:930 (-) comp8135_c0_seq1:20-2809(-)
MWVLLSSNGKPFEKAWLLTRDAKGTQSSRVYTINRKPDCDIPLSAENSVSRVHAQLEVFLAEVTTPPRLKLTDVGSKFGTFVNGERLALNSPRELQDGDRIKLGVAASEFTVKEESLVFCASNLDAAGKEAAASLVKTLGGHLVQDWNADVTHLIMEKMNVTAKLILALSCARPIITLEWLRTAVARPSIDTPLPGCVGYTPPPTTDVVGRDASLLPDVRRRTLFVGKRLLFLNKQHFLKLRDIVRSAGGEPVLYTHHQLQRSPGSNNKLHMELNSVVINVESAPAEPAEQVWIKQIEADYMRVGQRLVADMEISRAVISCSVEQFCNKYYTGTLSVALDGETPLEAVRPAPPIAPLRAPIVANDGPTQASQADHSIPRPGIRPGLQPSRLAVAPETPSQRRVDGLSAMDVEGDSLPAAARPIVPETPRSTAPPTFKAPAVVMDTPRSTAAPSTIVPDTPVAAAPSAKPAGRASAAGILAPDTQRVVLDTQHRDGLTGPGETQRTAATPGPAGKVVPDTQRVVAETQKGLTGAFDTQAAAIATPGPASKAKVIPETPLAVKPAAATAPAPIAKAPAASSQVPIVLDDNDDFPSNPMEAPIHRAADSTPMASQMDASQGGDFSQTARNGAKEQRRLPAFLTAKPKEPAGKGKEPKEPAKKAVPASPARSRAASPPHAPGDSALKSLPADKAVPARKPATRTVETPDDDLTPMDAFAASEARMTATSQVGVSQMGAPRTPGRKRTAHELVDLDEDVRPIQPPPKRANKPSEAEKPRTAPAPAAAMTSSAWLTKPGIAAPPSPEPSAQPTFDGPSIDEPASPMAEEDAQVPEGGVVVRVVELVLPSTTQILAQGGLVNVKRFVKGGAPGLRRRGIPHIVQVAPDGDHTHEQDDVFAESIQRETHIQEEYARGEDLFNGGPLDRAPARKPRRR